MTFHPTGNDSAYNYTCINTDFFQFFDIYLGEFLFIKNNLLIRFLLFMFWIIIYQYQFYFSMYSASLEYQGLPSLDFYTQNLYRYKLKARNVSMYYDK